MYNVREIDPRSQNEINLVALRMRETLIEVLGKEKGESMYSMGWLRDRVLWHLSSERDALVLLVESSGSEIVGQAIVRVEQENGKNKYGYFSTIYVAPESRNQGVAKKLIREVEGWCVGKRLPYMIYNTAEDNKRLVELFQRLGYEIVVPAVASA